MPPLSPVIRGFRNSIIDPLLEDQLEWHKMTRVTGLNCAVIIKALHGRLKSQRDGTGGKLTVDPPFSFRRERGTGKI